MDNTSVPTTEMLEALEQTISDETNTEIGAVLREVKQAIGGAEIVRFRPVDWKESAVVHVPGWTTEGDAADPDPKLLRRVFYDPLDLTSLSRVDCMVGLVARVWHIQGKHRHPAEQSGDWLERLKQGVNAIEYEHARYSFPNVQNEPVFQTFRDRVMQDAREHADNDKTWQAFLDDIGKTCDDTGLRQVIEQRVSQRHPYAQACRGQLTQLADGPGGLRQSATLWAQDTVGYYSELSRQWTAYATAMRALQHEVAVPVASAGRFQGVLNLHSSKTLPPDAAATLRHYSAKLAVVLMRRQAATMRRLQQVAQVMTGASNLETVSSEVAKGIRGALVGLCDGEAVFPLLYCCKDPIRTGVEPSDFDQIWTNSFYARREPADGTDHALWEKEKQLGNMPIRSDGLGYRAVRRWLDGRGACHCNLGGSRAMRPADYFTVCGDVDNPDGETGSRSALRHGIKTTGCLPLIYEDTVYGLLYLHCTERHFFTQTELEAIAAFGVDAAIAIKNAKLVGQSYRELYGSALADTLLGIKLSPEATQPWRSIGDRLAQWAGQVRDARGTSIADLTKATIRDIAGKDCLALPPDFTAYVDEFERREGALQSIVDYRDHFVHPFHVFCLGYAILTQWVNDARSKSTSVPLQLLPGAATGIDDWLKAWFIASVYHDVGYPAQKLGDLTRDFFEKDVGRKLSTTSDWSGVLLARDNLRHMTRLAELLDSKTGCRDSLERLRWLYKRLIEDRDHGILTAVMLLRLGWRDDKERKLTDEAALAVALHSWRAPLRKPHAGGADEPVNPVFCVEDLPLAFFLSFCDDAQEWGRDVLLDRARIAQLWPAMSGTLLVCPVPQVVGPNTYIKISYQGESFAAFRRVSAKFKATWYLGEPAYHQFAIQCEDRFGTVQGSIAPDTAKPGTGPPRPWKPLRAVRRHV